jgi:hypothetical protein
VVARAEIRGQSDDGIGQRESPLERSCAKNTDNSDAFYSFRKLTEVEYGVKAPCPSRYGVTDLCTLGIGETYHPVPDAAAVLTAQDADDILNDDSNSFSPQCLADDT